MITVAIVGRPNVGKSTLFNRLVGRKIALVDDTPGVTRDRREADARIGDLKFRLLDTAGFEDTTGNSLEARMRHQTELAIEDADLIFFMIDVRAGVTPLDERFGKLLHRADKPIHLVANKAEGRAAEDGLMEAYSLGFGEPIAISAEHGEGMADLHRIVSRADKKAAKEQKKTSRDFEDLMPEVEIDVSEEVDTDAEELHWDPNRYLNVAIVGRPNTGKSTLVNRLVGEDRLLTGPEAGITRDSILVPWEWQGRVINLVDTAGIRRRARVTGKLEKLAVSDSLRSIRYAEVVVLMLDATQPFEKQDLQLADLVEKEGRALVIAVNKWDLIEDKQAKLVELRADCEEYLPQLRGIPMVTLSGLRGTNIDRLMDAIFKVERVWNARIPTARLNRWLDHVTQSHPPPAVSGRRLKLRYATQAKSRPPSFIVFCSRPDALPKAYQRYLVNGLREDFDLPGAPIRLWIRGGDNPYVSKKKD